jgi:hypothetical protein
MSHDLPSQTSAAPYSPAPSHFSQSSMADPNVQQSRPQQPGAYPSPHSYPSPSMQPTYTYPPPQGQQQGNELYRGSPQGANMSLPPLNLPPIRLQDGQQPPPPQQSQSQSQQSMGSPLPPPPHGMPQYYAHQAHQQQHPHAPSGQQMMGGMGPAQFNAAMRYQLPPQHGDQRVLSGGRHKKEIKRRTKTGCLTCRKRRIKVSAVARTAAHFPSPSPSLRSVSRASRSHQALCRVQWRDWSTRRVALPKRRNRDRAM